MKSKKSNSNSDRSFLESIWPLICRAKLEGATNYDIYEILKGEGYDGKFTTFSTYLSEIGRSKAPHARPLPHRWPKRASVLQ